MNINVEKHIGIVRIIIEDRTNWEKEVQLYFDKEQISAEYQYAIIEKAQGNNATLDDLVQLFVKDKFLEMFLEADSEDESDDDIEIWKITDE